MMWRLLFKEIGKMQQKIAVLKPLQADCDGELLAYELAFNEAVRLSWVLPPLTEEESPLVARLGEATEKVCALLALAWSLRQDQESLIEHLMEAEALAVKIQTWVMFATEGGYISMEEGQIHRDLYGDILSEIRASIQTAGIVVGLAA